MQDSVLEFVRPFAVPERSLQHFMLAIEEIVSNALLHGGSSAHDAMITVRIDLDAARLRCEIIDGGAPFDPFGNAPEPDLSSGIAERQVGGLGIHIVKRVTDACSYERRGECNHTVLIKKVT